MLKKMLFSRRGVLAMLGGAALCPLSPIEGLRPLYAAVPIRAAVVYFSRTGTTAGLARAVCEAARAELFELKLVEPYAAQYSAMTDIARSERARNARRELVKPLPDLSGFDLIFLGSPYWWGGLSIPVRTFLMENPLEGKRVAPFVVSASSPPQGAWADLRELCPQASIEKGFHVVESEAAGSLDDARIWAKRLIEAV